MAADVGRAADPYMWNMLASGLEKMQVPRKVYNEE